MQGYGDRAGRGVPAGEGVGGGEGGQRGAVAGLQRGYGHVAGLLAAQAVLVLLGLAEHGDDGDQQTGAPERLQDGPEGTAVLGPGGERGAQPGVGGAVVVGEAGVGNVLVRHGPRPYRGEAACPVRGRERRRHRVHGNLGLP